MVLTGKLHSNFDFSGGANFQFSLVFESKTLELSNPPKLLFLGQVVILGKHPPVVARHNAGKA